MSSFSDVPDYRGILQGQMLPPLPEISRVEVPSFGAWGT
jgi:hypothetical protein